MLSGVGGSILGSGLLFIYFLGARILESKNISWQVLYDADLPFGLQVGRFCWRPVGGGEAADESLDVHTWPWQGLCCQGGKDCPLLQMTDQLGDGKKFASRHCGHSPAFRPL